MPPSLGRDLALSATQRTVHGVHASSLSEVWSQVVCKTAHYCASDGEARRRCSTSGNEQGRELRAVPNVGTNCWCEACLHRQLGNICWQCSTPTLPETAANKAAVAPTANAPFIAGTEGRSSWSCLSLPAGPRRRTSFAGNGSAGKLRLVCGPERTPMLVTSRQAPATFRNVQLCRDKTRGAHH